MSDTNAQLGVRAHFGVVQLLEFEHPVSGLVTATHTMHPATARTIANLLLEAADEADQQMPPPPRRARPKL